MTGYLLPKMWAAYRPALVAPAVPMDMVPTGTPPGICTMESSESSPFKVDDFTGTPITGSTVLDATIPGKWAAPPAPAIMTSKPRSMAVSAYWNIQSGVRWADTTFFSYGMPSSSKMAQAAFMVSQSDVLPMMTPTMG